MILCLINGWLFMPNEWGSVFFFFLLIVLRSILRITLTTAFHQTLQLPLALLHLFQVLYFDFYLLVMFYVHSPLVSKYNPIETSGGARGTDMWQKQSSRGRILRKDSMLLEYADRNFPLKLSSLRKKKKILNKRLYPLYC